MAGTSPSTTDIPAFSVQLKGAYVFEAAIRRSTPGDVPERVQSLDVAVRAVSISPDEDQLTVALNAVLTMPFREVALLTIDCTVVGEFAVESAPPTTLEVFGNREAVIILWPYLRAEVASLARTTAVQIPPIPTLDVLALIEAKRQSASGGPAKSRAAKAKPAQKAARSRHPGSVSRTAR